MNDDWYKAKIEQDINFFQSLLEPLEAGTIRIGEIRDDGKMNDQTQAQIDHIKRILATLQVVLEREMSRS
jgi:hypothetical protein